MHGLEIGSFSRLSSNESRYYRSYGSYVNGTLDKIELEFEDNAAVCVVLAN